MGPCIAQQAVVGSSQPAEHKNESGPGRPGQRWGVDVGEGSGGVAQCSGALGNYFALLLLSTCKKISEVNLPTP